MSFLKVDTMMSEVILMYRKGSESRGGGDRKFAIQIGRKRKQK
jgi:hypothetical protein